MRVRVKVCGITSYEDAALALDAGADAVGFNFCAASPRFLRPSAARGITRRLPPLAVTVGVFVNVADPAEVAGIAGAAGVGVIQLHGDETAEYCRRLPDWPLIKAVRIGADWCPDAFAGFPVQAFLLDSKDDRLFGGTGRPFDWALIRRMPGGARLLLAGGLNPENVAAAIRAVHPYGVDVCSGIESAPGKKDPARLGAFMSEVFNAGR
jgi:phosphoribosylanthranilate isomerase